jgi:hypothetical protein
MFLKLMMQELFQNARTRAAVRRIEWNSTGNRAAMRTKAAVQRTESISIYWTILFLLEFQI